MWPIPHLLLRRSCSTRFLCLFRGNCFICSCRFSMSVGGGEFSLFLCHSIGPPDQSTHYCFCMRKKNMIGLVLKQIWTLMKIGIIKIIKYSLIYLGKFGKSIIWDNSIMFEESRFLSNYSRVCYSAIRCLLSRATYMKCSLSKNKVIWYSMNILRQLQMLSLPN